MKPTAFGPRKCLGRGLCAWWGEGGEGGCFGQEGCCFAVLRAWRPKETLSFRLVVLSRSEEWGESRDQGVFFGLIDQCLTNV